MIRKMVAALFVTIEPLLTAHNLVAQYDVKVIILNPRVGPTIDSEEIQSYGIFNEIKDISQAIIYQTPEPTYFAYFLLSPREGAKRDTTVSYPKSYLQKLAEHIEQFEMMARGNYQIRRTGASLKTVDNDTQILVFLQNGNQVSGELLAVRDSSLVVGKPKTSWNEFSAINREDVTIFSNGQVNKAIIVGKSNAVKGMTYGFFIPATIGVALGFASGKDRYKNLGTPEERALVLGSAFGGLGLAAGAIYGAATSTDDVEIARHPEFGFLSLRPMARFPFKEPPSLREIQ